MLSWLTKKQQDKILIDRGNLDRALGSRIGIEDMVLISASTVMCSLKGSVGYIDVSMSVQAMQLSWLLTMQMNMFISFGTGTQMPWLAADDADVLAADNAEVLAADTCRHHMCLCPKHT